MRVAISKYAMLPRCSRIWRTAPPSARATHRGGWVEGKLEPTSHDFVARARKGLGEDGLQEALARFRTGFSAKRAEAAARLPEFEALRDEAVEIKAHTIDHLDFYLEHFANKVEESGGEVHWCVTPQEARQTVLDLSLIHI